MAAVVVALVIGGSLEVLRTIHLLQDPETPSGCPGLIGTRDSYEPSRIGGKTELGMFTLAPRVPDEVHQLGFGFTRQPDYLTIDFREAGGTRDPKQVDNTVLRTYISDFRQVDGRKFHNPKDQIYTQAIVGHRATIHLRVCFDPGSGRRIQPGTYTGTVSIDDDTLNEPAVASLQVTLKYPDLLGPLILVAAAVVAATMFKALAATGSPNPLPWLKTPGNALALPFGIIAVAAVVATFLRSPDWGANGLIDAGALFGAAFAAHVAGMTAQDAATKVAGQPASRTGEGEAAITPDQTTGVRRGAS